MRLLHWIIWHVHKLWTSLGNLLLTSAEDWNSPVDRDERYAWEEFQKSRKLRASRRKRNANSALGQTRADQPLAEEVPDAILREVSMEDGTSDEPDSQ